jgi:hypothetical protein
MGRTMKKYAILALNQTIKAAPDSVMLLCAVGVAKILKRRLV